MWFCLFIKKKQQEQDKAYWSTTLIIGIPYSQNHHYTYTFVLGCSLHSSADRHHQILSCQFL